MKLFFITIFTFIFNISISYAEYFIIDTNSANYKKNSMIDDDQEIILLEKEFLTIISNSGEKIKLEGPFSDILKFNIISSTNKYSLALESLFNRKSTSTATLGTVRSSLSEEEYNIPSYFHIPIDKTGVYCFDDTNQYIFYRKSLNSTNLTIKSGIKVINSKLNKNQTYILMPDILKKEGKLTIIGDEIQSEITLHRITLKNKNSIEIVEAFAEKKCDLQALRALY